MNEFKLMRYKNDSSRVVRFYGVDDSGCALCTFKNGDKWIWTIPRIDAIEPIPEPTYKTPTDEDAKLRPTVEVRHRLIDRWEKRTLLAVVNSHSPFACLVANGTAVGLWSYCRMEITQ